MSQRNPTSLEALSPKDWRATEIAMNHAGRMSVHDFQDLRSPRRAAARTRTRAEKYYHFKGLSPADLLSPHYLPVCAVEGCKTQGKPDDCWLSLFPADISTAPIRRFSKREAFVEAQRWPRPPTYHHTYQKDKSKFPRQGETAKWEKWRFDRRCDERGIRDEVWLEDLGDKAWVELFYDVSEREDEVEDGDEENGNEDEEQYADAQLTRTGVELPHMDPAAEEEDVDWDLASISTTFSWVQV